MKTRRAFGLVSLALILVLGLMSMKYTFNEVPLTYDGSGVDVVKLYENPTSYDLSNPDGAADLIVKTNLDKTMAANDVASIVFDYRGFDTLGESFILLTAIAGSYVILSKGHKADKEEDK